MSMLYQRETKGSFTYTHQITHWHGSAGVFEGRQRKSMQFNGKGWIWPLRFPKPPNRWPKAQDHVGYCRRPSFLREI